MIAFYNLASGINATGGEIYERSHFWCCQNNKTLFTIRSSRLHLVLTLQHQRLHLKFALTSTPRFKLSGFSLYCIHHNNLEYLVESEILMHHWSIYMRFWELLAQDSDVLSQTIPIIFVYHLVTLRTTINHFNTFIKVVFSAFLMNTLYVLHFNIFCI